jgi:hypothetical protein
MHPDQKRTNSTQIIALLLHSRAVIGSAWACTCAKGNTTSRRMSSFDGHFTRRRHQVKVIAERDHIEGITRGLGVHERRIYPWRDAGGRALRVHLRDVEWAIFELTHAMELALD